jgi:hypothetical protein
VQRNPISRWALIPFLTWLRIFFIPSIPTDLRRKKKTPIVLFWRTNFEQYTGYYQKSERAGTSAVLPFVQKLGSGVSLEVISDDGLQGCATLRVGISMEDRY